jgi:hypothetical protein
MQAQDSRFERLKNQVEYPEAWKPEQGDTLVGEALKWETVTIERDGEENRACDVLTLRDKTGKEWAVWTWHFVLQKELVEQVNVGDMVALHYQGRRAKQKGEGDYAAYRVAIEKSAGDGDQIPF